MRRTQLRSQRVEVHPVATLSKYVRRPKLLADVGRDSSCALLATASARFPLRAKVCSSLRSSSSSSSVQFSRSSLQLPESSGRRSIIRCNPAREIHDASLNGVAGAIEVVRTRFSGVLGGKGRLLTTADCGVNIAHRDRVLPEILPGKGVQAPVASRRASPITTTVVTMMRPKLRVAAPGGRSMCTSRSRFIAGNRSFSFLSGLATGSFGGARRTQER